MNPNFNFDVNSIAQWLPIALLALTVLDRLGVHTPLLTPLLKALASALGKAAPSLPTPAPNATPPAEPDADKKLREIIRDEFKKLLADIRGPQSQAPLAA